MYGIRVCISVRKWVQTHYNKALAIIALTAHALEQYERRAYEADMQGFLTKPINVQHLGSGFKGSWKNAHC